MADLELATINSAFLEYDAPFEEPIFKAWETPLSIISPVYASLRSLGLKLENVSQRADSADVGRSSIEFNLLNFRLVLRISLGGVHLAFNNPSWTERDTVGPPIRAAIDAALAAAGARLQLQVVKLGMHLTPSTRSYKEIISRHVTFDAARPRLGDPQGYGFSVYGKDAYWVVDRSWTYPGGIFVRIERAHAPETAINDLAKALFDDEAALLSALEIRLD